MRTKVSEIIKKLENGERECYTIETLLSEVASEINDGKVKEWAKLLQEKIMDSLTDDECL